MPNMNIKYTSGGIGDKDMQCFTKQLDFDEDSLDRRVDILHDILNTEEMSDGTRCMDGYFEEYFDTHNRGFYNVHCNTNQSTSDRNFTCRQLEFMANYLLYSSENMDANDSLDHPIEMKNNFKNARSTSYENMQKNASDRLEEALNQEKIKQYNNATLDKITEEDINEFENIRLLQDDIMTLRGRIDKNNMKYSSRDKQQMKKMMGDMKRTQFDIKHAMRKPISFNNVDSGRSRYTFWDNTGYYDSNDEYVLVSGNKLELSNYKHVYELIKYYGGIKEVISDDLNSDWRYLLWELEYIIDKTPLSPSERDIVTWKVDDLDEKIILDMLNEKHDISISQQRLSKIFTDVIPKKIVEAYLEDKLDWFYTFKIKGDWKECTKCASVKLASSKYFTRSQRSKDGYFPQCKVCNR